MAVVVYVLNAVGNQNEQLAPLRDLSPYGWAFRHTPLSNGADGLGLLLCGFSALFVTLTVFALRHRDILK